MVIVEILNQQEETETQESSELSPKVMHVECDCSQCIQVEDVNEEPVNVLAITRSGRKYDNNKIGAEQSIEEPKVW